VTSSIEHLAGILPDGATANAAGHLVVGGCDLVALAESHGTPLYVYDEATIRARARAFRDALRGYPGRSTVCYAAKAYCAPWLLRIMAEEGLALDVVSGGELHTAAVAGFAPERISFHGNNKTDDELEMAVRLRVGRVIVDNVEEIGRLADRADAAGVRQGVLLRVSPGVTAQTHAYLQTGAVDTKFGFSPDAVGGAVKAVLARAALVLWGLHAHIGSQIGEIEPYAAAVERLFALAQEIAKLGVDVREISPGGGYAVRYRPSDPPADGPAMAGEVARMVAESSRRHGFAQPPDLAIEPGRAVVATAGIALYRVGSVKEIRGVRTYVAVDGGMADNIRPTAYGAEYTALLAGRAAAPAEQSVAIAGRYCESGDVLIREVRLPRPKPGEILAIPVSGAYHLSMASNYNLVPRPAVVVVRDGSSRLVRRRETYDAVLGAEV